MLRLQRSNPNSQENLLNMSLCYGVSSCVTFASVCLVNRQTVELKRHLLNEFVTF